MQKSVHSKHHLDDMLYQACLDGTIDFAKQLINEGANEFELGFYGACEGGHLELMEYMIFASETQTLNINAGFKIACEKGHIALAKVLKEDYCADNFDSGAYDAALNGHTDVVILLLGYGATLYNSFLFASCAGGHEQIANIMINMGANDWNRCFGVACLSGHINMVSLILKHGGNKCNINDGILKASSRGNLKVIKFILDKKENPNVTITDSIGNDFYCDCFWASTIAKKNGYNKTSEYMLEYGNSICHKSFEYVYEEPKNV